MKLRRSNLFIHSLSLTAATLLMPAIIHAASSLAIPGIQLTGARTINGAGGMIEGNSLTGYFVESGSLIINNATLANFSTTGGSGSGGGAGLGGAIFVNSGAAVTLNNVSFLSNSVQGGEGGSGFFGGVLNGMVISTASGSNGASGNNASSGGAYVNGGNGVNGFNAENGGDAMNGQGGQGGKGGNGSDGSAVTADTVKAALELAKAAFEVSSDTTESGMFTSIAASFTAQATAAGAGANAGGPTTVNLVPVFTKLAADFTTKAAESTASIAEQAIAVGYETAYLTALTVTSLTEGAAGNGGSGGQGGNAGDGSDFFGGGLGGAGGDGGNAYSGSPSDGQGGGAGAGGNGGAGGFGGGGGQGGQGGDGGSSAKAVAGVDGAGGAGGSAGFGAGVGSNGSGFGAPTIDGGSGGSGYGGAIFVRSGGSLTVTGNALFDGNTAVGGGTATDGGTSGNQAGNDLFMMKGSAVTLNPGSGKVITFNGGIADDSQANIDTTNPTGRGAGLTVSSGQVNFNGENTYTGQTVIAGGILQAQDGSGIHNNSSINFNGGVLQSNGDFTRYVGVYNPTTGLNNSRAMWAGNGGFAAADGELDVRLSNGQTMVWNSGGFVPTGSSLIFGSETATDDVVFQNSINLNAANRTILVKANEAQAATLTKEAIEANVDNAILNGVISNGALTVGNTNHTGVLIMTNANTYSAGTTINGGTLVLAPRINPFTQAVISSGSLNPNGAMVANAGATLDISQTGNQELGTLAGAGIVALGSNKLTLNQAADTTFSGTINDGGLAGPTATGGSLTKKGVGTLTLSGVNDYTGLTQIDAGRITLSGSLDSLAVSVASAGTLDVTNSGLNSLASLTNSGIVNLTSTDTVASFTSNGGTLNTSGNTLTAKTYDLNTSSTINANLGSGLVTANGTVALNGTSAAATFNVVTGATTLGSAERLLDTVALSISSDATLNLGGNEKIGSLTGAGRLVNNGGRLTTDSGNFSGVISGSGGLTKVSTGSLKLTGANLYRGSTEINTGSVELSGSGSLAGLAVSISSGATLNNLNGGLASGATVTNAGILNIGSANDTIATLDNTGKLNGSATLTATTYTLKGGSEINANLGTGTLNVSDGTTLLNGTSNAATVNILSTGTLTLNAAERLSDSAAVSVAGTLNLAGGDETIRTLSGAGTVNINTHVLTVLEGGAFTGALNASKLVSKTGSLTLATGTTTTTDTNLINNGNLSVGNGATLDSNNVTVNQGSTLFIGATGDVETTTIRVNGSLDLTGGYDLSYATLTGNGRVKQNGNLFTNAVGSSTRGNLTFDGNLRNNGKLAPGNSPGTITILGNYTEAGTVEMEFENNIPGTGHDQIRVGGTMSVLPNANLVIQGFNNSTPVAGDIIQLFSTLTGGAIAANGVFNSVLYDADGVAGPGLATSKAAFVFDVATGRAIATGLNASTNKLSDLGKNKNQQAAAAAIFDEAQDLVGPSQINTANTTGVGFLSGQILTSTNPSAALALYSPDYYGAMADSTQASDRALARRIHDRISVAGGSWLPGGDNQGAFFGFSSGSGDTADNADADRMDYFAGSDLVVNGGLTLGVVVSKLESDISAPLGSAESDGIGGILYARSMVTKQLTSFGTLGYSAHDHDLNRRTVNGSVRGSTDSTNFSMTAGVQHSGWSKGALSFAPRFILGYSNASVDGFTETGAIDALTNAGYDSVQTTAELGLSSVWQTKLGSMPFGVELNLGIEQVVSDNTDSMSVNLVTSPNVAYSVVFADEDSTRLVYALNASLDVQKNTTIYLGLEGRTGNSTGNYLNLGVRTEF